nr:MAG TPA: hypothetical protein [Caudoviricetes sp.]
MQPRQPLNVPNSFIFSFIILYFLFVFCFLLQRYKQIFVQQTKTQKRFCI